MINFPPPNKEGASSACYEIGSVKEREKTKTIHKCINDAKEKTLFISSGSPVDLIIPNKETLEVAGYFLIHYQGKAFSIHLEITEKINFQKAQNIAFFRLLILLKADMSIKADLVRWFDY